MQRIKLFEVQTNNIVIEYFILNDPQVQIAIASLLNSQNRWFELLLPHNLSYMDLIDNLKLKIFSKNFMTFPIIDKNFITFPTNTVNGIGEYIERQALNQLDPRNSRIF